MRKTFYLLTLLCALFLYGCATQIEPPIDPSAYQVRPWKLRKVNLADKRSWDVQGVAGITSGGKTQMGSFSWKQNNQYYAINFYGPLNLGSIGIQGSPGQVTLNKPTGSYSAPNVETLMQQQLGWYLPVSNMYYWIRGIPAPGPKRMQRMDAYGHLVFLQQQGWNIQFQAFQTRDNTDLPRKIIMDNQQLRVKLVLKDWKEFE